MEDQIAQALSYQAQMSWSDLQHERRTSLDYQYPLRLSLEVEQILDSNLSDHKCRAFEDTMETLSRVP